MKIGKIINIVGIILTITGVILFLLLSFKIIGEKELVTLIYIGLLISMSSCLMVLSILRIKSFEIKDLKKEIDNLKSKIGE